MVTVPLLNGDGSTHLWIQDMTDVSSSSVFVSVVQSSWPLSSHWQPGASSDWKLFTVGYLDFSTRHHSIKTRKVQLRPSIISVSTLRSYSMWMSFFSISVKTIIASGCRSFVPLISSHSERGARDFNHWLCRSWCYQPCCRSSLSIHVYGIIFSVVSSFHTIAMINATRWTYCYISLPCKLNEWSGCECALETNRCMQYRLLMIVSKHVEMKWNLCTRTDFYSVRYTLL